MSQPLLRGDALKQASRKLAADLQSKIDGAQQGVGTFSDHVLISVLGRLERLDDGLPWEDSVSQLGATIDELRLAVQRLQLLLGRRGQGRHGTRPRRCSRLGNSDAPGSRLRTPRRRANSGARKAAGLANAAHAPASRLARTAEATGLGSGRARRSRRELRVAQVCDDGGHAGQERCRHPPLEARAARTSATDNEGRATAWAAQSRGEPILRAEARQENEKV